jgi:hypothetical protein
MSSHAVELADARSRSAALLTLDSSVSVAVYVSGKTKQKKQRLAVCGLELLVHAAFSY